MGLNLSDCECIIYFQIVLNVIHSCFTAFSAQKGVNHCLCHWEPGQVSKHLKQNQLNFLFSATNVCSCVLFLCSHISLFCTGTEWQHGLNCISNYDIYIFMSHKCITSYKIYFRCFSYELPINLSWDQTKLSHPLYHPPITSPSGPLSLVPKEPPYLEAPCEAASSIPKATAQQGCLFYPYKHPSNSHAASKILSGLSS